MLAFLPPLRDVALKGLVSEQGWRLLAIAMVTVLLALPFTTTCNGT